MVYKPTYNWQRLVPLAKIEGLSQSYRVFRRWSGSRELAGAKSRHQNHWLSCLGQSAAMIGSLPINGGYWFRILPLEKWKPVIRRESQKHQLRGGNGDHLGKFGAAANGKTYCIILYLVLDVPNFWRHSSPVTSVPNGGSVLPWSFPGKPHQLWAWCHCPHPGFQLNWSPFFIRQSATSCSKQFNPRCLNPSHRIQEPMMVPLQDIPSEMFEITGLVV